MGIHLYNLDISTYTLLAGIKYELLASVCTKGKKCVDTANNSTSRSLIKYYHRGFLRRRKSNVVSTQAAIIIDKHELHSTWPVYCQPETRQITNEGVTLTVERNHTCYGPGDRISVMATLKSDNLHTILLRGFELTLKESTIFRAGPYTSGKKSVPQVRVVVVAETRLPVNFSLYGGMVQKAELTCGVSPNHTTTTLNTARHIDITYILSVKALLGTGQPLVMDLPVVLSNWQRYVRFSSNLRGFNNPSRNVSQEATRRIGAAPGLSLLPANASSGVNIAATMPSPTRPTITVEPSNRGGTTDVSTKTDELDYTSYTSKSATGPKTTITSKPSIDDLNPTRMGGTGAGGPAQQAPKVNVAPISPSTPSKWLNATDEKKALYEQAKKTVAATQAAAMAQNNSVRLPFDYSSPITNVYTGTSCRCSGHFACQGF